MHILDAEQVRAWDAYTIQHEPIAPVDLMERAARSCFHWLMLNGYKDRAFTIYCGKGNNGGDGLALARMLLQSGHSTTIYILEFGHRGSDEFQANLERLHSLNAPLTYISTPESLHEIPRNNVIIDALFGSGLNKPLTGLSEQLVQHLNQAGCEIISIDLPSGLYTDKSSKGLTTVRANHVLSFQCYKPAFVMAENAACTGELHILDIGLLPSFINSIKPRSSLIEKELASSILRKRPAESHKGLFGHGALIAGSKGMMGAATLAAGACVRSGIGKLTCHVPECGYMIMQIAVPEAMCVVEAGIDHLREISSLDRYDAVGIGPGWGLRPDNEDLLAAIFQYGKPLVIDADALNSLSVYPLLRSRVPHGSILTPHPKEFERLFGKSDNDFERMEMAVKQANALQVVLVLKGRHTLVATPGGHCFFNTTGNAGMAKAGSGDTLTGMVLSFLAQGYPAEHAACISVYLHGRAADLAVVNESYESLLPSGYMQCIGRAIRELYV